MSAWQRQLLALMVLSAFPTLHAQTPSPVKVSEFLRPPGSNKYDTVDWNALPPWRQTSFYGLRSQGKVFIFVVDCSGSMAGDSRLEKAKYEIRRTVAALRWPQKFHVIFYNDRPLSMPGGIPLSADLDAKQQLNRWFQLIQPEGETDPRAAMSEAISLKPDAVFLLSDGEFPDGTVESIAKKNTSRVPIHCIDLAGGSGASGLKQIADQSGGQYALRSR